MATQQHFLWKVACKQCAWCARTSVQCHTRNMGTVSKSYTFKRKSLNFGCRAAQEITCWMKEVYSHSILLVESQNALFMSTAKIHPSTVCIKRNEHSKRKKNLLIRFLLCLSKMISYCVFFRNRSLFYWIDCLWDCIDLSCAKHAYQSYTLVIILNRSDKYSNNYNPILWQW